MTMRAPFLLICLGFALGACQPKLAESGNPNALSPILGGGGLMARGVEKPTEPVEDYAEDLGALLPAWPAAPTELPQLIKAVIARGTWVDVHHAAVATADALRVRHRPEVIVEVKKLMADLRTRLLRPVDIQVAFVEVNAAALPGIYTRKRGKQYAHWSETAFRSAVGAGNARVLSRVVLSGHNGQWVSSDRVSNQVYISGFDIDSGAIKPRTTALASGFTIQAAAWRWGEERAVVACTGLYTGEAVGTQEVTQTVHRELPRKKTTEHQYEAHQLKLSLPVREMMEFQGQVTVYRKQWSVAALVPRDGKRVSAVLMKVSWQSPPPRKAKINTFSKEGYLLDVIPIALPTDTSPLQIKNEAIIGNRRNIADNSVKWFKSRAKNYQQVQKANTFNLKSASGELTLSPDNPSWSASSQQKVQRYKSKGLSLYNSLISRRAPMVQGRGPSGVMPEALEKARNEVMLMDWPAGTALEFVANHVFVVHKAASTAKVRTLLERTHDWRNRRVFVEVAFPTMSPGAADGLAGTTVDAKRAAGLRRQAPFLPVAILQGRGGSWSMAFAGEMHAVLSGAWSPERASPAVHVFWRGNRLAIQPRLSPSKDQQLELRWKQHRLEKVAPKTVAGTVLQQPADSLWTHDQRLRLPPGQGMLTGLHGDRSALRALLVESLTLK